MTLHRVNYRSIERNSVYCEQDGVAAGTSTRHSGWENGNLILLASGVSCYQREIFASRLGHQHAAEGIPVNQREAPGGDGVLGVDSQLGEPAVPDALRQVCWLRRGPQFASAFPGNWLAKMRLLKAARGLMATNRQESLS
jgi:hypothetical protein